MSVSDTVTQVIPQVAKLNQSLATIQHRGANTTVTDITVALL
jgi:hypothetical protein